LLNVAGGGSKVDFGNLLIVPIDQGLLYVRPYYVRADKEDAVPELRKVVVAIGDQIEVGDSLGAALAKLIPGSQSLVTPVVPDAGGTTTTTVPGTPESSATPDELITEALGLFDEADAALKSGGSSGLSDYQTKTSKAEDLIRQAQTALNGGG